MNIIELINHQQLTYEDLLERTGIPASTLDDILSGKADLKRCQGKTLFKLAKGIGVRMEDVVRLEPVIRHSEKPDIYNELPPELQRAVMEFIEHMTCR